MILEGTIHCEGPDCGRSAHVGADTMAAGRLVPGFVMTVEYGSSDMELAFCGWDCVMKYAAQFPAPERIEM